MNTIKVFQTKKNGGNFELQLMAYGITSHIKSSRLKHFSYHKKSIDSLGTIYLIEE